jgi:hypothetical protein
MVPWLKYAIYVVEIGAIAYFLACLTLIFVQRRLIFIPCQTIEETPADYGLPYESVFLPMPREETIHG